MAKVAGKTLETACDSGKMQKFMDTIKLTVKAMSIFNNDFTEFLDENKKLSKDLSNWVTRYNILNAGPPCVYPEIQKEELLQEMLVKIQDKSRELFNALQQIKLKFDKLPQLHRVLEKESQIVDWDPSRNILIKSSVKHLPPSQYLEDIADILFQYDVCISSIFQYFDALELHEAKSYEHLMNSYALSSEVTEFVREFLIKAITLLI